MKYTLDWKEYENTARQAVAEGIVLLENKEETLPLKKGQKVSVFGRIQNHYYKSGTGSGGMVNVTHVFDIPEGLRESGHVTLNDDLYNIYQEWEKTNPFEKGLGWGMEPWSQKEMPLTEKIVTDAAAVSDVALFIVGRTAGEDKDAEDKAGSYQLTETEIENMKLVRKAFKKMVVLLNVGGLVELNFIESVNPESVVFVWQGGMMGGLGTADVLTGKVSPSGHLSDTIAYKISDYLSDKTFGDPLRNVYEDDIYVGYRYFETFEPSKVRYPFGYGLSYTTFSMEAFGFECDESAKRVSLKVKVTNTGKTAGKEVVQIYTDLPEGELEKPSRVLTAFAKTSELAPGDSEVLSLEFGFETFASFDTDGDAGNANSFILEDGLYRFMAGNNIRDIFEAGTAEIKYTVLETVNPIYDGNVEARIKQFMPEEIPQTGDKGMKLKDVTSEEELKTFVAQLSDEELSQIVRGEGMGSSLVTPGTASAFGGVSKSLRAKGLVPCCCDDGPSGMRLDCGTKAFSLPNGTMLACTFNLPLNEKLFTFLSMEMTSNKVDCLLGPGINIHRHPLNGRNFEYFSEDPLLTGLMAIAQLKGLKSHGAGGCLKHFAGNNQEFHRHTVDSVISPRALREIYLKAFEMAVKSGYCDSIMTTYGVLNGIHTASNFDLCTTVLRQDWGYKGFVMTDWWACIYRNEKGEFNNLRYDLLVRSQNDVYMVYPNGEKNINGENTLEALSDGSLTRGELQRTAMNVCRYVMNSESFKRSIGKGKEIEIINRPKSEDDLDTSDVEYTVLEESKTFDLSGTETVQGTTHVFAFDVQDPGEYRITLSASSELSELAQMTCTYIFNGFPVSTVTFNGTGGKIDTRSRVVLLKQRFIIIRLSVGANGLKLNDIKFEKVTGPVDDSEKINYHG